MFSFKNKVLTQNSVKLKMLHAFQVALLSYNNTINCLKCMLSMYTKKNFRILNILIVKKLIINGNVLTKFNTSATVLQKSRMWRFIDTLWIIFLGTLIT